MSADRYDIALGKFDPGVGPRSPVHKTSQAAREHHEPLLRGLAALAIPILETNLDLLRVAAAWGMMSHYPKKTDAMDFNEPSVAGCWQNIKPLLAQHDSLYHERRFEYEVANGVDEDVANDTTISTEERQNALRMQIYGVADGRPNQPSRSGVTALKVRLALSARTRPLGLQAYAPSVEITFPILTVRDPTRNVSMPRNLAVVHMSAPDICHLNLPDTIASRIVPFSTTSSSISAGFTTTIDPSLFTRQTAFVADSQADSADLSRKRSADIASSDTGRKKAKD